MFVMVKKEVIIGRCVFLFQCRGIVCNSQKVPQKQFQFQQLEIKCVDKVCFYSFSSPSDPDKKGFVVVARVLDLQMRKSPDCALEYLEIRDGTRHDGKVLLR